MALRLFNWPTFDLYDSALSSWPSSETTTSTLGAVDIVEKDDVFLIVADTPGMTSADVKVDVKDNYITLSGERKEEHREESSDKKSYRLERSYGQFSRSFRLPANTDAAAIQASCENGVLKVTLPKVKPATPKGSSIAVADKHHA